MELRRSPIHSRKTNATPEIGHPDHPPKGNFIFQPLICQGKSQPSKTLSAFDNGRLEAVFPLNVIEE